MSEQTTTPKRKGRPPRAKVEETTPIQGVVETPATSPAKRKGRPPKATQSVTTTTRVSPTSTTVTMSTKQNGGFDQKAFMMMAMMNGFGNDVQNGEISPTQNILQMMMLLKILK